jgi:hypothetical protein
MQSADLQQNTATLARTAMVAGEVFIPGASDLIAGNIGSGVAHFVLAGLASAIFLPTMPLIAVAAAIGVRVSSYQHATTGINLWGQTTAALSERSRSREAAKGD